ncbi:MAG: hypothetical protein HYT11_04905 [Candidatus Levybacteria bacterium]|nr:hypothetical protein [Candidatus Levybacteria bacterium]
MKSYELKSDAAEESRLKKVRKSKDTIILTEKYEDAQEISPPPGELKQAFSQAAQFEVLTRNIEVLLYLVIFFAPSAIEVLEPSKMTVGPETIQIIMNSVADMIHRFAAQGAGGMVVSLK